MMIGFSIEFKRWYIIIRGPKGRTYLATGFAERMPLFTPTGTLTIDELSRLHHKYEAEEREGLDDLLNVEGEELDDSNCSILADEWREEEEDTPNNI